MKIAILGYGKQGRSAYDYWRSPDNQITVCDKETSLKLPDDVESRLGPDHLKGLDRFDLIVRSPIVHPRDIVAANSPNILQKVTTVTNEFFKVCPTKNIIGVTGTKGKGTTSTLIANMLEAADKRVHLGGNIGTPPLDLLKDNIKPEDWVVLELANFQLIDLKYSPHTAVCLMVVPEHLDWHSSMDEYLEAKRQLFAHQNSDDVAIYYADNTNSEKIAEISKGQKIPYFAKPGAIVENDEIKIAGQTVCQTSDLKLLGKHNWQNVCAATTAVWFSLGQEAAGQISAIQSVATNFSGLPHRLEFVREVGGIKYYNDSFAATPEAAAAAIEAIPGPKVLIAGGFDRGLSLDVLADAAIKDRVKHVVCIGQTAGKIAELLEVRGQHVTYEVLDNQKNVSMDETVTKARSHAEPGDSVVLSPGCASFDMFKNFEDRGQQFKEVVQQL